MAHHSSTLPAVLAPVITPFDAKGAPDAQRLARQCQWLLSHKVGLAIFGTNSEANSMSVAERIQTLQALLDAGLPADQMMPGSGACAVTDAITLTRAAVEAGCAGTLTLPPFYYKDVSDDGLFAYFATIIEAVAHPKLQVYLYNIPPVAKVGFSIALVERLIKAYPKTVVGMKDSSGDWAYTESVMQALNSTGFRMYAGAESFLMRTLRAGGVGCISATANVNPGAIAGLAANWQQPSADQQQSELDRVRSVFQRRPMIAAMKAAVARYSGDAQWAAVRPPLVALSPAERDSLLADLDSIGFSISGL